MHRFAVGQRVIVPWAGQAAPVPSGTYVVVQLLPLVGGEPHYRVKSTVDGRHRALLKSQMLPGPPKPRIEQLSEAGEVQPEGIAVPETENILPLRGQSAKQPACRSGRGGEPFTMAGQEKGGTEGTAEFREETSKKADSAVKDRIAATQQVGQPSNSRKVHGARQH